MVIGLDEFAAHFAAYQDRYILIGGAATWLVLNDAGLDPRATKDLDIVLCLEALDPEFGAVFWDFIHAGGYELQEKSTGEKVFYRFQRPSQQGYPVMLELFSRKTNILTIADESHLTPIPIGEDVSSLSAILMEEGYYEFLHQHKIELEGISLVGKECLIPLKARAWLDLTQRKAAGGKVDSKNINKYRTDILRLYHLFTPETRIELPETIRRDLASFLQAIELNTDRQLLKNIGIIGVTVEDVMSTIRVCYGITEGQPDD
ncbi:MAG: hypothetical protein J7K75_04160 [Desulfuromonas sp.]|nr:hypothetical protein [Desulfuromonas sp.]